MTPIKARVAALLQQMTLEEKLAQLGSCWVYELQNGSQLDETKMRARLAAGIGQITRVAGASTATPLEAARTGNRLQKHLREQTRLGIPAILHEESCSGAMIRGGTAFPQVIGLASTFRPELASEMTSTIRRQLLAIGARQSLAPVLDVARDPRWGRTEETFGEDPFLISNFGVAYVRGLQSEDIKDGVMATGKHFIGHSLSQGGQNCAPVHMGKHDLYDIFLGPFQAVVRDARIATMMNSYPELDGEVVAASRSILTDLLRRDLGFDGLVVSDYEAILMLHTFHKLAPDLASAATLALKAGIDVELPTTVGYGEALKGALERGELDLETIDTAVSRHLQKKFELGLFETPYVDEGLVAPAFETAEQRALARRIACDSLVLLKNDGTLPFKPQLRSLAVIGPNADSARAQLGDYSYAATMQLMTIFGGAQGQGDFASVDLQALAENEPHTVTVLAGVRSLAGTGVQVTYARGCDNLDADASGLEPALESAHNADAVVLVLGDRSGLVPECTTGETRDSADLRLPGLQGELARRIFALGKPVVVVLINGRPYAIPEIAAQANAILEAWLPGEEGGIAIAEALFGVVNPGGKLPITFPRSAGQLPIFYNQKPSAGRSHWYGDYVAESAELLYPFGHGLSYTTFTYSDLVISAPQVHSGESVSISCRITNSGTLAGDEVVQLYLRDEYASLPRPVKELKGFARVHLEPGESRLVSFQLPVNIMAFFDHDLQLTLEPGAFAVMLGASSADIRLEGAFELLAGATLPMNERIFSCPFEVH